MHSCLSLSQGFRKPTSDTTATVSRTFHRTATATTVSAIPTRITVDSFPSSGTFSRWSRWFRLAVRRASGWRWRWGRSRCTFNNFLKVSRWCPARRRFVKTGSQPPSCNAFLLVINSHSISERGKNEHTVALLLRDQNDFVLPETQLTGALAREVIQRLVSRLLRLRWWCSTRLRHRWGWGWCAC
jgi:hypothetical protein